MRNMSENEEIKQENPAETPEVKEVDQVQEAKQVVEQLKEQNALLAKNLERQEKLQLQNVLSGKTNAGTPQKSQEEKAIDNARDFLKGSGYEDDLFPK